jgi:hypothetical protein
LVDADPVGKQAQLHAMDNRVPTQLVAAAIQHAIAGTCVLSRALPPWRSPAENFALGPHDGHGHVPVSTVHDVAYGILAEGVADSPSRMLLFSQDRMKINANTAAMLCCRMVLMNNQVVGALWISFRTSLLLCFPPIRPMSLAVSPSARSAMRP